MSSPGVPVGSGRTGQLNLYHIPLPPQVLGTGSALKRLRICGRGWKEGWNGRRGWAPSRTVLASVRMLTGVSLLFSSPFLGARLSL